MCASTYMYLISAESHEHEKCPLLYFCHYHIIHLNPYYGEIYQNICIKFLAKYIVCNSIADTCTHKCRISCAFEGFGGSVIRKASTLTYCFLFMKTKTTLYPESIHQQKNSPFSLP